MVMRSLIGGKGVPGSFAASVKEGGVNTRVRAPFHESNIRLYKTKIMTKNKTS